MMRLLLLVLVAASMQAAIEGTVTNGTKGGPVSKATVSLIKLGQGMETVGSTESDAEGKFRFAQEFPGPALVQVTYQDVNYSHFLVPGQPRSGFTIEVFEATASRGDAKVGQHMILLEPHDNVLDVNETLLIQNSARRTVLDPKGAIAFTLPEAVDGKVLVNATSPGSTMPLTRQAEKVAGNVYKVEFALKPGESKLDLAYQVPTFGDGGVFQARVMHDSPLRLVTPAGVELSGPGVSFLDKEPTTQASIYELKGSEINVTIKGQGRLQRTSEEAGNEGPDIEVSPTQIHKQRWWILGLLGGILTLTLVRQLTMAAPGRS